MRIGISTLIVRPNNSGSNEPYLVNLIKGLARIDDQNEYLLFVTPQNQVCFESVFSSRFRPVLIPPLGFKRPVRILLDQFVVPLIAARRDVDVLHFPGTIGSVMSLRRPRNVVTIHYCLDEDLAPSCGRARQLYVKSLFKASCRAASCLIVPSSTFKQHLAQHWQLSQQHLCVVNHGVAQQTDLPTSDGHAILDKHGVKSRYLISVTNTLPHKNLGRLIKAYSVIKQSCEGDLQLVLVGSIDPRALNEIGENVIGDQWANLRNQIVTTGFLPHQEVMELCSNAVLLANPSLIESLSMTLLEAQSVGVPVVASDIPIHREIVGDTAILVDPLSSPALADACLKVMNSRDLSLELSTRGRHRSESFSWDRTARETLAVYQKAGSSNGHHSL